jgi:hypothetical protein
MGTQAPPASLTRFCPPSLSPLAASASSQSRSPPPQAEPTAPSQHQHHHQQQPQHPQQPQRRDSQTEADEKLREFNKRFYDEFRKVGDRRA